MVARTDLHDVLGLEGFQEGRDGFGGLGVVAQLPVFIAPRRVDQAGFIQQQRVEYSAADVCEFGPHLQQSGRIDFILPGNAQLPRLVAAAHEHLPRLGQEPRVRGPCRDLPDPLDLHLRRLGLILIIGCAQLPLLIVPPRIGLPRFEQAQGMGHPALYFGGCAGEIYLHGDVTPFRGLAHSELPVGVAALRVDLALVGHERHVLLAAGKGFY